jgi:hypothetical protein
VRKTHSITRLEEDDDFRVYQHHIPAKINLPKNIDPDMLRLGMVARRQANSDKARPIGFLATILLWVKACAAYL